jgi:hypothetical protein
MWIMCKFVAKSNYRIFKTLNCQLVLVTHIHIVFTFYSLTSYVFIFSPHPLVLSFLPASLHPLPPPIVLLMFLPPYYSSPTPTPTHFGNIFHTSPVVGGGALQNLRACLALFSYLPRWYGLHYRPAETQKGPDISVEMIAGKGLEIKIGTMHCKVQSRNIFESL